jgi:hypothetical protein
MPEGLPPDLLRLLQQQQFQGQPLRMRRCFEGQQYAGRGAPGFRRSFSGPRAGGPRPSGPRSSSPREGAPRAGGPRAGGPRPGGPPSIGSRTRAIRRPTTPPRSPPWLRWTPGATPATETPKRLNLSTDRQWRPFLLESNDHSYNRSIANRSIIRSPQHLKIDYPPDPVFW